MSIGPLRPIPFPFAPITFQLGRHEIWFISVNHRQKWLQWLRRIMYDYPCASPEQIHRWNIRYRWSTYQASPKKPLFYRIRDMAPYILSGDYKNTLIINPYDECFELDLLLNQLCFHYSFTNRQVKPGLKAILFCQAHCLRPSVQQTVAIAGFTRSHDLLPFTPVYTRAVFWSSNETLPLPCDG
jgi:hypothetical protein